MRKFWARLNEGRPGRRFQDRYHRAKQPHDRPHLFWRVLKIMGGMLALIVGIVEVFFPGPAILFLFVGGGLLATEFLVVARFMDWAEVHVRQLWHGAKNRWHRFSRARRNACVVVAVCAGLAAAFVMARVVWT